MPHPAAIYGSMGPFEIRGLPGWELIPTGGKEQRPRRPREPKELRQEMPESARTGKKERKGELWSEMITEINGEQRRF